DHGPVAGQNAFIFLVLTGSIDRGARQLGLFSERPQIRIHFAGGLSDQAFRRRFPSAVSVHAS
ncbi:MAG: hypothetical protein ABSF34_22250, partial [Verrucomicrobiota bacterium]